MSGDNADQYQENWARALRVGLCALVAIVPLIYSPAFGDYSTPKIVVFLILVGGLAAGLVVQMVLRGEVYLIETPVLYTMLAFLAAGFVSLFQSYNIYQGLQALLYNLFHFILVMLTLHLVTRRTHVRSIVTTATVTGLVVAVIGLMQHNGIYDFHHPWNIPVATIGNVNFVAEYYNIVFPVSLALLVVTRKVWLRIGVLMAVFFMTCHLIVLGSRGGWLGAIVAAGVFAVAIGLRYIENRRRIIDTIVVGVLVLILAAPVLRTFGAAVPAGGNRQLNDLVGFYWDGVVARSEAALRLRDDSSRQRVLLWEDTIRMVMDHPIVGVGIGNYEFNIARYHSPESLEMKSRMEGEEGPTLLIFRAHNEYLEIWSETGMPGILAFVFLVVQVLRAAARLVLRYASGEEDELVIGLTAALAATLAHAFFSSNFQNPAASSHFWLAAGLVLAVDAMVRRPQRIGLLETGGDAFSFGLIAVNGVLALLVVYYGIQTLAGSAGFISGKRAFVSRDYPAALEVLERARSRLPPRPFATWELIGKCHYYLQDYASAERALGQSLAYHPYNAGAQYFLGRTLLRLDRPKEAIEPLQSATRLSPFRAGYKTGYAAALDRAGRAQDARQAARDALSLDPNLVGAIHLLGISEKNLGNLSAARAAYEQALAIDPDDADVLNSLGVIDVQTGRFERAVGTFGKLFKRYPDRADYGLNLAVATFSAGDSTGAIAVTRDLVERFPDFGQARVFLRDVLNAE